MMIFIEVYYISDAIKNFQGTELIDLLIVLTLIFFHGLLALIEVSYIASKKIKLQERKNNGDKSAGDVLKLLNEPEKFLSIIQTGITLLAILVGVYGGAKFVNDITPIFQNFTLTAPFAGQISLILVVGISSYLSITFGDLVPKTIALNNPEKFASLFTPVIKFLLIVGYPFVTILTSSTKLIINIFKINKRSDASVTEEELKIMISMGTEQGVLHNRESEILHTILRFNDIKAKSLMTPRKDIVWIDFNEPSSQIYHKMITHDFSRYPVCNGTLDNIIGIIETKEFLAKYNTKEVFKMEDFLYDPLIISGEVDALSLLDKFRLSRSSLAFVIDEKDSLSGIITLNDLLEHIVGELPDEYETEDDKFFKREDGSYLIDANFRTSEIQRLLPISFDEDSFGTIGGMMISRLGRMPRLGDKIIEQKHLFEIVDMDGIKIDKVLVSKYMKTVVIE